MRSFLLFTVYAPLASWGDITVGERRGSWDRPSRSAILGMIAAALGVDREDQSAHDALDAGYGIAVRLDAPGSTIVDYHTTQSTSASAVRKFRPPTRAAMLSCAEPETMLSRRWYRQDALATVCIWAREEARWRLVEIADALKRPVYMMYAGRKANALGLPCLPHVVDASTLRDALSAVSVIPPQLRELRAALTHGRTGSDRVEISHDECDGFESGLTQIRREVRRDAGAQRTRWQFAERIVEVGIADARSPQ